MKKKMLTYLLLFSLMALLTFLYGFALKRNGHKKINRLEVEFKASNSHFLTHKMVDKMLIQNGDSVKNLSKSSVDLHRVEKLVLKNPYVEKAAVFLTLNEELKVQIKQREPLVRFVTDSQNFYADKYGVTMPVSQSFSARVPLVLGVNSVKEVKKVIKLILFVNNDDFLKKEVVAVEQTAENNYVLRVRSGDYKIDLGDITDLDIKFKKLKAFYNKTLVDGSIKKYETITLKYRNQVVCTKQKQDGKQ